MGDCSTGVQSAQWSVFLPDGAIVDACAGDVSVIFPWMITLGAGEEIANVEWFYHRSSDEMIGTFTHGNFFSMPSYSQRVLQVNTTGLVLSHVTDGDAGKYSVEVMVRDPTSGVAMNLRHSAVLVVYSQSKAVTDATVQVTQEPGAVYNNATGRFHVHLTCATYGRQPPAVVWTLPSGATEVVSTSESGKFSLLVPNPVSGGNYTCSVHPDTPAARCLPTHFPALQGHTVYVDRMEARLTLLEAKDQDLQSMYNALQTQNTQQATSIQHLQTENSQQAASIQTLQTENSQQANSIQYLQAENSQLKNRLDQHLQDMAIKRVAFHAKMSSSTQLTDGARLILSSVLYNQGNGYSSSTGTFTAPYSGTYVFLVSADPEGPSQQADVFIRVDGGVVSYCDSYAHGDALACNVVAHLIAGQTAWVGCWGGGEYYSLGTAFSGFLISTD